MRHPSLLFLSLLLVALAALPLRAQAPPDEARQTMAEMINAARRANQVGRLAWNNALAEAAQLHAEDIAQSSSPGHIGSDGSTVDERVQRAGYLAYPDGMRVSENWSSGSAMSAMAFFIEDQIHRDNLLLPIWREVGVGHVTDSPNGEIWVVDFGAQPGVLPAFINEDEPRTTSGDVTLSLSQEEAGWDEAVFTQAVEIRLSDGASLDEAAWQPWQAMVPYTLTGTGERRVTVEYRDAQGHTVRAEDTIFYAARDEGPVPTSAGQFAPTLTASPTPTDTPTPTITPTLTASPTPTPTPTPTPLLGVIPRSGTAPLLVGGLCLLLLVIVLGVLSLRNPSS